jgi:hypothetical protein
MDTFGRVPTNANHSGDVLPSFAPTEVSKALSTATFEKVAEIVAVVEKALTMLMWLSLDSLVLQRILNPFCPIVPFTLKFTRA